jgi:RecA-family ATPase
LPEEHWNNKPLKGSVIYLSAEDDPEFTIKKRVRLHGGDCSKVIIIGTTLDNYYMFNLNKDLKSLEEIVKRKGDIKLIVFDPLPAYLGVDFRFDSHKESHVRGVLAPITKFAEKHDLTVIGIMHLNKGDLLSVYRVSGSGAFVCAARSVSLVGEDKYDKGLIHFLPWKINLVKKPFGISYRIVNEMIKFEDFENKTTPEELLSQQERVEYPREDAKKFLMTVLGEGQVRPATEIVELSKLEGISRKTLDRAKQDLRIRSDEVYDEVEKVKRWVWFLPPDLVKKKEPQVVTDKK